MGQKGLVGHLRPMLLSNVNYSPPQRRVCSEVNLFTWAKTLDVEDSLSNN